MLCYLSSGTSLLFLAILFGFCISIYSRVIPSQALILSFSTERPKIHLLGECGVWHDLYREGVWVRILD